MHGADRDDVDGDGGELGARTGQKYGSNEVQS
jgi:hypothetical protein